MFKRVPTIIFSTLLFFVMTACDQSAMDSPKGDSSRPGGTATVMETGPNAFSLPSANMPPSRKVDFSVGNSFFRNPWVIAPSSTTARDGLGPLFNTNACQNCHIKDGRGHPADENNGNAVSMLVRLSIPALPGQENDLIKGGVIPEPVYGGQLQDMANPGIPAEGKVRITYTEKSITLADGSVVNLRHPELQITNLAYGPLHPQVMTSIRVAPPMIGLGLLEAIPEQDLLAQEDAGDKNVDGISGRANRVWGSHEQGNEKNQTVIGRFGWKAGQPSLNQQNAGAFAGDMGLSSRVNGADDCTSTQTACREAVNGNDVEGHEVSNNTLANVLFYSRNLAVPARRNFHDPAVAKGEKLFNDSGCAACHTPSFTTSAQAAEPELASQVIYPYTDLLLHDLGEGLADHRSEFMATGSEWRTPPLWGIGLTQTVNGHTFFLHDGRARNLLEAILWHGGEAQASQQAVVKMTTTEREALLKFVESL